MLLPFVELRTDARGEFAFEGAGFVAGALLTARRDGAGDAELALPPESRSDLVLELRTSTPSAQALHGIVLDPHGTPVEDALVSLGTDGVRTDAEGRFLLPHEPWQLEGAVVRAFKRGHQSSRTPLEAGGAGTEQWPLELYLGPPPASLRGRVLDAAGRPVPHARVWSPDTTFFGQVPYEERGHDYVGVSTSEALQAGGGGPAALSLRVTADARGEFELHGLQERSYAVFASDPRSLCTVGPVTLQPGTGSAELRLGPSHARTVRGQVVSTSGAPLAGLRLDVGRRFAWERPAGSEATRSWSGGPLAPPPASVLVETELRTDEQGRFTVEALEVEGAFFRFHGPQLYRVTTISLDGQPDLDRLRVEARVAGRFRVRLAAPTRADAFRVSGREPSEVLTAEVDGHLVSLPEMDIVGGVSGVALFPAGEVTLILMRDGEEVERRTVLLEAGGVTELAF
jgi:hypothetical protein